jgi:hypothetical protein
MSTDWTAYFILKTQSCRHVLRGIACRIPLDRADEEHHTTRRLGAQSGALKVNDLDSAQEHSSS